MARTGMTHWIKEVRVWKEAKFLSWSHFSEINIRERGIVLEVESSNLVIRYVFFLISQTYHLGCLQFCFKSFQNLYSYLNLMTTLQGNYYYFHFVDEEIDA